MKKILHVGKVPEAYKDVISDVKVVEVRRKVKDDPTEYEKAKTIYGTPEEMLGRAKEGYFVRDPERNQVYCPAGEILRQKCIKKNGNLRYANKNACKTAKTETSVIKVKANGKRLILRKTISRSHVKSG